MNPVNKKIKKNNVVSRFLPITQSVLDGLEAEPKITDFTLLKELGEGSYSHVLLAQHNITQAQYAIKAIDKRNKNNVEEKDYFRREAEIMYRINHPNIIKLYGHFEDNTYCYFIMEYMAGGNAYSLVPKYGQKKISPKMTASILKDVISATYYLHHMVPTIIHRDIKPENVLINAEMKAKLTDFGWSNYLNKTDMKRTTMCGTPIYLAPELVNNTGHDHRIDIWCIGVLMFELLTGLPPWIGDDVQTLKYNIARMNIRWPKNMDPDAMDLIKKTLRYNPDERISLRNMLMHPFFTKYFPNAVNCLIKPDGSRQKTFVISRDNPQILSSSIYNNNIYDNNLYNNNNYNYSTTTNNMSYIPITNKTTIEENPYTPPTDIITSYPTPTPSLSIKQPSYNISTNNYNKIFNSIPISNKIKNYEYPNNSLNNLSLKELIENQERIDELVRKTGKFEEKNKITYQYPIYNNYNNKPILQHSSSSVYKSQSPYFYSLKTSNNPKYSISYNKGIKYSLPTKYSIQPVKYSRPKIVYSSMTAKRNFEGDQIGIGGRRQLSNLYNKFDMSLK